jgi:hypothetical protein
MRVEKWLFMLVALFMYVVAAIYAYSTWASTHVEWSGTVTLALAGTLSLICGTYFGMVSRRIRPRPEDRDGDVAERAGRLGFFAPRSYWPFAIGLGTAIAATGIALRQAWLLAVGLLLAIATAGGLAFEFYHRTDPPSEDGRQQ